MKIINNGGRRLVNRYNKKVMMPIMTSPTSNFVVELQRGEVADG
jgi:hypothetical protein